MDVHTHISMDIHTHIYACTYRHVHVHARFIHTNIYHVCTCAQICIFNLCGVCIVEVFVRFLVNKESWFTSTRVYLCPHMCEYGRGRRWESNGGQVPEEQEDRPDQYKVPQDDVLWGDLAWSFSSIQAHRVWMNKIDG